MFIHNPQTVHPTHKHPRVIVDCYGVHLLIINYEFWLNAPLILNNVLYFIIPLPLLCHYVYFNNRKKAKTSREKSIYVHCSLKVKII